MNSKALAKAIASLKFVDVFIRSASSSLADNFDPKFDVRCNELSYQTKSLVTGSEILEVSNGEPSKLIFRVCSELGVRMACKGEFDNDASDPDILAIVEGVMYADYEIVDPSIVEDQEALDAFALNNAPYHVWPYWREYVTSQMLRMNMPKFLLPMQVRPSNQKQ